MKHPSARSARAAVESYLEKQDLDWEPDGDDAWYIRMDGDHKKGISMVLRLGDHTMQVESYFVRAPEPERGTQAYLWLLQRNLRQYLRFACDEEGAIHLVGQVPLECIDEDELDRLVGSVLEYQDLNWMNFLELGFPRTLQAVREGKPVPEE